jgi:UDP-2,3-diacylglucosamine pyrophosphatase LpxH
MGEQAFVLSDLHIGAGQGDSLEDFTSDKELAAFLDDIDAPETTLIINGDFVDFARIEPLSVRGVPGDLLWDHFASVIKLETALGSHKTTFGALSRFLDRGGRLRTTVGNHDLDFAWPQVQERFRREVGGDADRVTFTTGATNYAGVHIEHGHQFTPENCPEDPNDFFHDWNNQRYIERVWGTDFLLSFFNDLHHQHPYADKLKPTVLLAYHAIKNGWVPAGALLNLVLFLKRRGIAWRGLASSVLDDPNISPFSLVGVFEEDSWRLLASEIVHSHSEEVSDLIAALDRDQRAVLQLPKTISLEADVELESEGAATLGLFRDNREVRGARDRLSQPGVTSVVFGHTHEVIDGGLHGTHFNPGCWIPHLNLRDEDVRAKVQRSGVTRELLSDASLYRINPWAVVIRPGHQRSRVELIEI